MNGTPRLVAAGALALLTVSPSHARTNDDPLSDDVSVVLTPTRLKQSIADVPGSVTVITADMLDKYGIRSVPEALRLVPGMEVTQLSNSDYRINYHGTNIYSPRRLNVLIDGVSAYRSAFARVDWTSLPVSIDDIQRIEVTRGPNSASYGPNSMEAIVNIITKDPQATDGAAVRATGGSRGLGEGYVRYSGRLGGSTRYRASAEHSENKGFDQVSGFGQLAAFRDHDAARADRFTWRSTTELTPRDQVDLRFSLVNSHQDQVAADQYQATFPDVGLKENDLSVTWRHTVSANQEFKVQAYQSEHKNREGWVECVPAFAFLPELGALWKANPDYVRAIAAGVQPSGGTAQDNALLHDALLAIYLRGAAAQQVTCGNTNNDYRERRRDIELQHTYVFSKALRVVSGVGLRRDEAVSQTYLGGTVGNTTWRAFFNMEYRPFDTTSMNAGGFYQKDSLTGSSFSPRLALNQRLNANNTVRFVLSRADRMPDIIEQRANWSYLTTNMTPPVTSSGSAYFAQSAQAAGNLDAEKMTSREIGYSGNFPQYGLMLDAKVFDDRLSNLVSQRLSLDVFRPTNEGEVRLRGAELQADLDLANGWSAHAGYTRLNNHANNLMEQTQYAKNSALLGVSRSFDSGWRAGLAVYWASAAPYGQSRYGRQDLTLSKVFRLGSRATLAPVVTVSHLSDPLTSAVYDVGQVQVSGYNSSMRYTGSIRVTY
jgi:iron complex outermembrane receptor protein